MYVCTLCKTPWQGTHPYLPPPNFSPVRVDLDGSEVIQTSVNTAPVAFRESSQDNGTVFGSSGGCEVVRRQAAILQRKSNIRGGETDGY